MNNIFRGIRIPCNMTILLFYIFSTNIFANIEKSHFLEVPIVSTNNVNGISEQDYHNIINKISKVYKKRIEKNGIKLKVYDDWTDSTVTAFAEQNENVWSVHFPGGYARIPGLTSDAFALIVCHEFGHHLGGQPKMKATTWASTEGQSDFWASSICFPEVFKVDNNINIIRSLVIPEPLSRKCKKRFKEFNNQALCIRQIFAGEVLNQAVFKNLKRKGTIPSLLNSDKYIVFNSDEDHPEEQCRIDTVVAASLCNEFEFNKSCKREIIVNKIRHEYTRPLCWYRPSRSKLLTAKEVEHDAVIHFPEYAGQANIKKMQFAMNLEQFDINIKNKKGEDAFYKSSEANQIDILKYLFKFKTLSHDHTNHNNISPMGIAAQKGYLEVVKFLTKIVGVDINKDSNRGYSALYIATKKNQMPVVEYLLSLSDIDINKSNYFGDTPLFIAIEEDNEEIIDLLLKRKELNLKHQNNQGDTALSLADFYSNEDLYIFLKSFEII